jgi:hypothetical protein
MEEDIKKECEYFEKVLEATEKALDKFKKIRLFCWLCGSNENITRHHIEPSMLRKGDGKGYIILCKSCHTKIENIKEAIKVCYSNKLGETISFRQFKKTLSTFE